MKILCTGDLHLGRRSSRLPSAADVRTVSCAHTWDIIVSVAIAQSVDIVALSGDLVDKDNKFFEAIDPLRRGIERLALAGIDVVAVAGNHDHDVLPRLASTLGSDRFRLLGRGGAWERIILERHGQRLAVHGWSFPQEHVRESPLTSYVSEVDPSIPTLGLLHADLSANSVYAPITLAELQACPVTFWLLGHIHAQSSRQGPGVPTVLYPGSPQAMDPNESGEHGVWLADIQNGMLTSLKPYPLSSVRYETAELSLDGVTRVEDIKTTIAQQLQERITALVANEYLRYLSLRLRVTGATSVSQQVQQQLASLSDEYEWTSDSTTAWVERVSIETRAAIDLPQLAQSPDAVGMVARLLNDLDAGTASPEVAALMSTVLADVEKVRLATPYQALPDDPQVGREALPRLVRQQATRLLDKLLAQRANAATHTTETVA